MARRFYIHIHDFNVNIPFFPLIGLVLFLFWSLVRFPSLSAGSEGRWAGGGGLLSLFFVSLHQRSHLASCHALVIWTCSLLRYGIKAMGDTIPSSCRSRKLLCELLCP